MEADIGDQGDLVLGIGIKDRVKRIGIKDAYQGSISIMDKLNPDKSG